MPRKIILIMLLCLINLSFTNAQFITKKELLKSDFAKRENKENYYGNLLKNIDSTFASEFDGNTTNWIKCLRDAQSINLNSNSVKNGLIKILNLPIDNFVKLQKVALEIAYGLFPNEFLPEISGILKNTKDPVTFVISANYLRKNNLLEFNTEFLIEQTKQIFGENSKSLIIKEFLNDIDQSKNVLPSLEEILSHPFQNGKTIIYSFQRKDRTYAGLVVIKTPNGEFVKNEDGSLFWVPQLALSFSNLPSYIPNGNTPQGIYSLVGWYISPTETIGPTPNLLTRSPFEVSPNVFFHDQNNYEKWNRGDYSNLLPDSWKSYEPIYNSFNAGNIGRKLIIAHGSTDESKYFKNERYYPLIPTRGCLSSFELWDEKNGKCLESDQLKLINNFRQVGQKKGFLVVIELDDQKKPVELSEIEKLIKQPSEIRRIYQ